MRGHVTPSVSKPLYRPLTTCNIFQISDCRIRFLIHFKISSNWDIHSASFLQYVVSFSTHLILVFNLPFILLKTQYSLLNKLFYSFSPSLPFTAAPQLLQKKKKKKKYGSTVFHRRPKHSILFVTSLSLTFTSISHLAQMSETKYLNSFNFSTFFPFYLTMTGSSSFGVPHLIVLPHIYLTFLSLVYLSEVLN